MEACQTRLQSEYRDLNKKLEELRNFLTSPFMSGVDPLEKERLYAQEKAMFQYQACLSARLGAIKSAE